MARRRHILAYDIADDARRRLVYQAALRYGYALQYSVFQCDLDEMELTRLTWMMADLIDHSSDSILIVDLGLVDGPDRFTFLGRRRTMRRQGPTIV